MICFYFGDRLRYVTLPMTQIFKFVRKCPPLWMGKLARVIFYSTVDAFKRSGAEASEDPTVKDDITSNTFNGC